MTVVNRTWVETNKDTCIASLKSGDITIYPTDTIYGIGCNALDGDSIQMLRTLKQRPEKPFSVIAPSKDWIRQNFFVPDEALDRVPGPVTIILRPRDDSFLPLKAIHPGGESVGVRIPHHWFSDIVAQAGIPFITTSVNISNESHMERLEDIPVSFHDAVKYCIYEGPIHGTSSVKYEYT